MPGSKKTLSLKRDAKCIFHKMDLYRYKCDACDFTLDWAETGHYFVIDYSGQYHICNHFRPYRDISHVLNIEENLLMKALWNRNKDPKSIFIQSIVPVNATVFFKNCI